MKQVVALAVVVLVVCGGCRQPPPPEKEKPEKGPVIGGYQSLEKPFKVKSGKEITLVVLGEGSSALGLYIYDRDGNCVAHDDQSNFQTKDDLAVSWIPQKEGEYSYELVNLGPIDNQFKDVERLRSNAKEKKS